MTSSVTDIPPKAESIKIPMAEVPHKAYSEKDVNIAGTLSPLKGTSPLHYVLTLQGQQRRLMPRTLSQSSSKVEKRLSTSKWTKSSRGLLRIPTWPLVGVQLQACQLSWPHLDSSFLC